MAECKDCVHFVVCTFYTDPEEEFPEAGGCELFMPAADVVEVRHGEWRMRRAIVFDCELVGYNCSRCNTTWDTETNYCPTCGAKMDGKGEE
jgi:hypothetical protein